MYNIKTLQESPQIQQLNELFINVPESLPTEVEQSIYYPKLKTLLHAEIINFCKEQTELRDDLNFFRMSIGQEMDEEEIRAYLDGLKEKYNSKYQNIGIDYDISVTKFDYAVPVFCVIKRQDIILKKFVFRFRKHSNAQGINPMSTIGLPLDALKNKKK